MNKNFLAPAIVLAVLVAIFVAWGQGVELSDPNRNREVDCTDLARVKAEAPPKGLSNVMRSCLHLRIEAHDEEEAVLRLLADDAFERDRKGWRNYMIRLSEVSDDPMVDYKLAVFFAARNKPSLALQFVEKVDANVAKWTDENREKRIEAVQAIRVKMCEVVGDVEKYPACGKR